MSASLRTRLFLALSAVIAVSFAGMFWWVGRDALLVRAREALIVTAALALLLAYVASRIVGGLLARRLRSMRARVDTIAAAGSPGLAEGMQPGPPADGPSRRARKSGRSEWEELAGSIGRVAERVEEEKRRQESEREDWRAMVDSLDSGLAVVDGKGLVVRTNATFAAWAGRSDPAGQRITTLFRTPELAQIVDQGLSGTAGSRTISVGNRSVRVSVRPHRAGALVLLRDLTRVQRLEGVRRDFVANVSHELKTPLTSIMGFAEAIAESELPADHRKEFAGRILANVRRMRSLVDDLLDLARIESGRWEPAPETVDLTDAVRSVWNSLEPAAREGTARLGLKAGETCVYADPGAVRQIFLNLFDNALRYAPSGSEVRVEFRLEGEWIRVEVSDSGPGIPSAHVPRIFERFYRVDPARSREAGGTGLGLAIVKHLVTAHGGEVGAESELGRGTTLWFTLPAASDRPAFAEEPSRGGSFKD